MEFIDVKRQYESMKSEMDEAIHKVIDKGRFIMGEEVQELEQELASYVGVKHCIASANGTDSLQMSLMALGVGKGDEVITTPFSFISTADVISLLGATPVFADIDPQTYNIDPSKIEEKISSKTKAIIAVGIFGHMPDVEGLKDISEKHGIEVIEDAAQCFGATANDLKSCSQFAFSSTSFFPAKPLSCYGDGGAVFTDSDSYASKLRAIRVHGGARHDYKIQGINSRLDTLQAAVVQVKLKHYNRELKLRREVAAFYNEQLKDTVVTPFVQNGYQHVYAQYTIRVPSDMRQQIMESMKSKGVPTGIYYPRIMPAQEMYQHLDYTPGDFPVAEKAASEVLSLPMHPYLTQDEQLNVVNSLKESLVLEGV
ncbi:MAG: DegT/DnrJ/EryC1/StrS family aminotransferase [Chlamydiales bacterium]|nr:DegT/DnrJ/EryC1/StrS family aminotransferase [Chlamydiales bacterium]